MRHNKPHSKKYLALILILLCSLLSACMGPTLPEFDPTVETGIAAGKYGKVSYSFSPSEIENQSKLGILFLHGTPGDRTAFQDYLTNSDLKRRFLMVSLDRYGWGESQITNQANRYSFSQQAEAAVTATQQFEVDHWIVVGHSYGASLAGQVALELNKRNPDLVSAMVVIAGSLDPELGKPRWYNQIANLSLIHWALPSALKLANNEIMNLKPELAKLNEQLNESGLPSSVIVIQGMKDKLVSPKNAEYARTSWGDKTNLQVIELPSVGHFIPWEQAEVVTNVLLSLSAED